MKKALLVQHLRASNDSNGNPRRAYVIINPEDGCIVEVFKEDYAGSSVYRRAYGPDRPFIELPSVEVSVTELNSFLKYADLKNKKVI